LSQPTLDLGKGDEKEEKQKKKKKKMSKMEKFAKENNFHILPQE